MSKETFSRQIKGHLGRTGDLGQTQQTDRAVAVGPLKFPAPDIFLGGGKSGGNARQPEKPEALAGLGFCEQELRSRSVAVKP